MRRPLYTAVDQPPVCLHARGQRLVNALYKEGRRMHLVLRELLSVDEIVNAIDNESSVLLKHARIAINCHDVCTSCGLTPEECEC